MRLAITILIILVFVLAGIVFGALNVAMVTFDLGFAQLQAPKGAAILAALVIGWLLGGLVAWTSAGKKRRKPRAPRSARKAPTDGP